MTGLVGWATTRARMILAFVLLSLGAGIVAYTGLPKEGSPDIDIPILYVSVPYPGISAADSERLLVKPLEQELRTVENLDTLSAFAYENHAGVLLEFDFGWDKPAAIAEVRNLVDQAKADFPDGAEEPQVYEVNLSEFPILIISLSGDAPERTLLRLAKDLQREIEGLDPVLEAGLAGHREEMLEVLIDPLKLEAYDITANELLNVVSANNQLIAAGAVQDGAFAVKVPGAFETAADITGLPVKVSGDSVVRLGDIAEIRRTFDDPEGEARYNGDRTVALQVKKRAGQNIIDTVNLVRDAVAVEVAQWPEPLRAAVIVDFSMDESKQVLGMVDQLEASVLTAVLLVMIVVLVTLGLRSSLLVGFAIPCSFLLTFALMAALGLPINNMVMFGLILAVGMLVDGAIVVVEYADKRITQGQGPMRAYSEAARRMFWPIVSSTATTLCAFLPMLFWPGIAGQFMGQLPVTLIFVLSASLIVALIYLPVIGGSAGRITRNLGLRNRRRIAPLDLERRPGLFARLVRFVVTNPLMPFAAIGAAFAAIFVIVTAFSNNNNGIEFFVKTEPERAIAYVRARGNLSVHEKDRLVRAVEDEILDVEGVSAVFAFSGSGGLEQGNGGEGPADTIGQVQIELAAWGNRPAGDDILAEINRRIATVPGVIAEISEQKDGPQQGKPVQLQLSSPDWGDLLAAAEIARERFDASDGLTNIDDTRPLPGIDWRLDVDRAQAGRFGADVAQVGALVQLVTRGADLGSYRPDDTDDELEIRVRFPEQFRTLSTLDHLKLRTSTGLVPMSNFVTRSAEPKLASIDRQTGARYILLRADVTETGSENAQIEALQEWMAEEPRFPAGVSAEFTGDLENQQESQAFLQKAFAGALGLMFVILLAQFNSIYNSILVLTAVVMSVAGVLLGMMVMGQSFSIIMTGTGIVALAGIVVNNNIVLIDTYRELSERMPPLEAIVRTAEQRIRPVLLTTITTMAGLAPMMFAMSVNFGGIPAGIGALFSTGVFTAAGWSAFVGSATLLGAPTSLWWVQLATAVVFGLGSATLLTLLVTPAALAARIWVMRGLAAFGSTIVGAKIRAFSPDWANSLLFRDRALARKARKTPASDLIWVEEPVAAPEETAEPPIHRPFAAE